MLCLTRLGYVHTHIRTSHTVSSYVLSRVEYFLSIGAGVKIETLPKTLHARGRRGREIRP